MIIRFDFVNMNPTIYNYKISCEFPKELLHEKLFKDRINTIYPLFIKYIELHKQIDELFKIRDQQLLDVTKDKFTKEIEKTKVELREVEREMNKDLSPYLWLVRFGNDYEFYRKRHKEQYIFYLYKSDGDY